MSMAYERSKQREKVVAHKARKANGSRPILPRPGDPYITDRGEAVRPEARKTEIKREDIDAKTFKASKKRSAKDLPTVPSTMNGIACVFVYTLFGVGDREIAEILKITTKDVREIRGYEAYGECFKVASGEFVNANSAMIQARIASYGHQALDGVADIAFNGKKEEVRLTASRDLLDRGGHNAKSVKEQSLMVNNDLRIVIVDGKSEVRARVQLPGGNHGKEAGESDECDGANSIESTNDDD